MLLEPGKRRGPRGRGRRWRSARACAIGLSQGFFIAKLGVPSFVVTLAGSAGLERRRAPGRSAAAGTIVIQDNFINGLANNYIGRHARPGSLGVGSVFAWLGVQAMTVYRRRQAGLPNAPWSIILHRTGAVLAIARDRRDRWADTDRGHARTWR